MPRQGLDRARVVAEAALLADQEGLDGVTLAALAARLGVRAPSLYKHVDGLDGLRGELAALAVAELADALGAAIAGRADRDALRAGGAAWAAYARAHPGRYALTLRSPIDGIDAHRAAGERAIDLIRAALRGLDLEGDDELHAIRAVRSGLHGFCALEAAEGFALDLDRDATLARLLDVLWDGLRAGR